MIKKIGILALVAGLFLVVLSPSSAQVQGKLTVLDSSTQVEFPSRLGFSLSVESDANITDIRLRYKVDRESFARVISEVYIKFVPGTAVDVEWSWDMRRMGGLPSGSNVEYWWVVEDAGGERIETAPIQVQFDDTRYPWRGLDEGMVTIYWYEGEEPFAQELMITAQQVLNRLTEDTGAHLEKPVNIYIYASARDLQGAMIFPQEWTGGVAFTRYGVIAIGIAPDSLSWGRRAMAHELAHLVIHQVTFNPYGDLPTWLSEGLAMYAEGELEPGYTALLDKSIAEGSLISVRSLSSPFSAYAEEALLSYAQSYSLVEFLTSSYGADKMLGLLNIFEQGSGYDGALVRVYGFDMDVLDTLWRDYVTAWLTQKTVGHPALSGTSVMLIYR